MHSIWMFKQGKSMYVESTFIVYLLLHGWSFTPALLTGA